MKTYATAYQTALDAGAVADCGAVKVIGSSGSWRYWSGYGDLTLASEVYTGLGDRMMVTVSGAAIGTAANGATIEITGIESPADALRGLAGLRGASVQIWRLGFDPSLTTLLDSRIWTRGRLDKAPLRDRPGGDSVLRLEIETPARSLGRALGRMLSDPDQRLIDSGDDCCKFINIFGEKKLAWGGRPPKRASETLPNAASGSWFFQVATGGGATA